MARKHRKLFPLLSETNQTVDCSTGICEPACPYNCYSYPYSTIPPEQPPSPTSLAAPSPAAPEIEQQFRNSPSSSDAIIIITVASVVLIILLTGFVFGAKFVSSRRNREIRQQDRSDGEPRDEFLDGDQVDHPIWFIRTTGLQQSIISSITICRYRRGEGLIEGTDCPVCLNEFQEDEALRLLPKCNHAFHISCIDTWLRSHTNCPLCRASIVNTVVSQRSSLVDASPQVSSSQMEHSEDADEDEDRNVSQSENRDEPEGNQEETTLKEPVSCSHENSVNSIPNPDVEMGSSCLFDDSDRDPEVRDNNQSKNWDEPDGEEQSRVSRESLNPDVDNSMNSFPHLKTQIENTDFPGKSYQNHQNQEPRRINQSEDTAKPETETHDKTMGEEASCSNNNGPNDLQYRKRFHSMDAGDLDRRTSEDTAKSQTGNSSNMLKLTGSSSTSRFNRSKSSVFPLQ